MKKSTIKTQKRFSVWLKTLCLVMLTGWAWSSQAQVALTATAGTATGSFTTVNAAFTAINAGTHQGSIVITVTGSTTEPATPVPLLSSGTGSSIYTAIKITPSGNATINGTLLASRGVLEFQGADNVTIDGDDPLTSGTRNLTISRATSTTAGMAVIRFASVSATADGASNNAVKNCMILGNRSIATSTVVSYGIYSGTPGAATTSASGASYDNDNILIDNCDIERAYYGIYSAGTAATSAGGADDWTITNNYFGNATAGINSIGFRAVYCQNVLGWNVSNNTIQNLNCSASVSATSSACGIYLGTSVNMVVNKNILNGIASITSSGYGIRGILVNNATALSNTTISNNFITDVWNFQDASANDYATIGIGIEGGSGGVNLYYNTVNLYGSHTGYSFNSSGGVATCLYLSTTVTNGSINIANNNFSNTYVNSTSTGDKDYAIYATTANTAYGTINNNNYYAGAPGTPVLGFNAATDRITIADIQTGFGQNLNSISVSPVYVSSTDLHLQTVVGNASLNGGATPIVGITTDIDNNTRDASTPDIGADEINLVVCAGTPATPAITPVGPLTACVGGTQIMTASGATSSLGISYNWEVSNTSGSGFTPISGATNLSYTATLSAGTFYYRMATLCSTSGLTSYTNELLINVNALPTVAISSASSTLCSPGGAAINLTGSGAATYSWSPSAGLTPATGANVAALPSATTTYTLSGTDANGCVSTATQTITVNPGVSVAPAASPSTVCAGGSSVLNANATVPGPAPTYCQPSYSTGTGSGDYCTLVTISGTTLNNPTGASASPYYTLNPASGSTTASLTAGSTYTITVSAGTYSSNDIAAWIDYNQNGTLDNAGEKLGEVDNIGASPTTATIVFTVPLTAYNGSVRFRVREADQSTSGGMEPCNLVNTTAYGETEDYVISISGGAGAAPGVPMVGGTFLWSESPANSTLASTNTDPVNANNINGSVNYTVIATSTNGCSATGSVTVSNVALACQSPTLSSPVCSGTNFTVTAHTTGGGIPYTYTWDDGMGGVYVNSSAITANMPAGSYTFTVTVTDGCGASCSSTVAVTVNAFPSAMASGSTTGLTYQTLNYSLAGTNPGETYQWQFSTSATGPWTNIGTNISTLSTTATSAGTFYIQCVITNAAGCVYTTNQITTVVTVAGDMPCAAVSLPIGLSGPYTNIGATVDAGEPVPASNGCNVQNGWCNSTLQNTVWFSFVAPPSGRVVVNTGAPLWDNQMALYSATNCGDYLTYTQLAANDDGGDGSFAAKITSICLVPGQTYYVQVDGYNGTTNGAFYLNLIEETAGVQLAAKAFLAGAYDASLGLMHDSIRANGLVPLTEPYTGTPYSKPAIGEPSGETTTSTVLGVTGNDAIVDWVYIELRNSVTPSTIIATKRALIQRDGDIVGVDGVSPVSFPSLSYGSYYVSVKHRNHLGVMTATPVVLGPCTLSTVDFINGAVWVKPGELNGPRKMYGAIGTLWSSDANRNKNSKYNGLSNDKQEVLNAVGAGTPNNSLGPVYRAEDLNMDTKVRYNNTDNDRNVIANTVGVNSPNNIVNQHTPN